MTGANARVALQVGLIVCSQAALGVEERSGLTQLEEVVVTAQKRDERLMDVPVPVAAIAADTLVQGSELHLRDYYDRVPGLELTIDNRGAPALAVRGISTGLYSNPTVGVTVDDVPFGASTGSAFSWAASDLDPNELARVEVLRGPQGTLYGASSIGGLIKFVTVEPSIERLSGRLEAGANWVHHGEDPGYNVSGHLNLPVSGSIAVRGSVFANESAGYIDNPILNLKGVNSSRSEGGHLSGLWKIAADSSLELSALLQRSVADGSPYVELRPDLGQLQQDYIRNSGRYERALQAYRATLKTLLWGTEITWISGYGINHNAGSFDITSFFGDFTQAEFGEPGTAFVESNQTRKFSQELRLSRAMTPWLDLLAGVFYTYEHTDADGAIAAFGQPSGARIGTWLDQIGTMTYAELAGFADLTVHVNHRLDIQFGGRESRNRQVFSQIQVGPYVTDLLGESSPSITPKSYSADDSFTYLVTPRLRIEDGLMVYARFASGYRPGGPNSDTIGRGLPIAFGPDTTENYELGIKAESAERTLSLDASLYWIDWKNLQIQVLDPNTALEYTTNASRARSRGVETTLEFNPLPGLHASTWVAFNDAKVTEPFPSTSSVFADAGSPLPYAARWTAALSVEKTVAISDSLSGLIGATASYVGTRTGEFGGNLTDERQRYPSYVTVGLRAGLSYRSWDAHFFLNNLTDRRGLIGGGLGTANPLAFHYIQPRTAGFSIAKTI